MKSEQSPSDGRDPRETLLAVELQAPRGHVWFPSTQFDMRSLLIEAMVKMGVGQGTVTEVLQRLDLRRGQPGAADTRDQTYDGFSFEHHNGSGTVGLHIGRFREEVGAMLQGKGLPVLDLDRTGRMYFRNGEVPRERQESDVPPELRPFLLNGAPRVTPAELGWRSSR
jgi:hypothetical protein